jgi:small multidrug resistance pump/quaternary ammonium compound-resistance protein SugE
MPFSFLVVASVLYAIGGLFMKLSNGMSRPAPTAAFLMLFVVGATFQALGMRRTDLVVSYIFVLGAEAVVAVLLSALYLHERYPPSRVAAILVILVGMLWLKRT